MKIVKASDIIRSSPATNLTTLPV